MPYHQRSFTFNNFLVYGWLVHCKNVGSFVLSQFHIFFRDCQMIFLKYRDESIAKPTRSYHSQKIVIYWIGRIFIFWDYADTDLDYPITLHQRRILCSNYRLHVQTYHSSTQAQHLSYNLFCYITSLKYVDGYKKPTLLPNVFKVISVHTYDAKFIYFEN